jgi:hypothetical protein
MPKRDAAVPGGAALALALLLVALAQVTAVKDRLGAPFLDGRMHDTWDNAFQAFHARAGLTIGGLRQQFGTTDPDFVRWGEVAGTLRQYTDHPFLVQAVFQQVARLSGTSERSSRTFSLAVAFGIAAGLLVVVRRATASLAAALLAALVLVSLPLFSTFQTAAKYELNGMLFGVWLFAALMANLGRPDRARAAALAVAAGLGVLAHWTAGLLSIALGLWLFVRWRRKGDPLARRALVLVAAGEAAGAAALAALMVFVQGSPRAALAPLTESFVRRSSAVPWSAWLARQSVYLVANFGWAALGILAVALLAVLRGRRRSASSADAPGLGAFIAFSAATGALWVLAFRQGSFIHVYWQLWLALPAAAAIGWAYSAMRSPRARAAAGLGILLLVLHLRSLSAAVEEETDRARLGTPEDIAFLSSLRSDRFTRFAFLPLTEGPFNDWFQGPIFEYYTDRRVAVLPPDVPPKPGEKLLVLKFDGRDQVLREIGARFDLSFPNEVCGPRFCARDVVPADGSAAPPTFR